MKGINTILNYEIILIQDIKSEETDIIVIGATNVPWTFSSVSLRQFQEKIYIPLPNRDMRLALFKQNLEKTSIALEEGDFLYLAEKTEG